MKERNLDLLMDFLKENLKVKRMDLHLLMVKSLAMRMGLLMERH